MSISKKKNVWFRLTSNCFGREIKVNGMLIKCVNAHTPLPKYQNIINLDSDNLSKTIHCFFVCFFVCFFYYFTYTV